MRHKNPFSLYAQLPTLVRVILGSLPFVLLVGVYYIASTNFLETNPNGRMLPSFAHMVDKIYHMATQPNSRSDGEILLWLDLSASLSRLGIGVAVATVFAFVVGPVLAMFPLWRSILMPTIEFFANFIIISLMVIVMAIFGVGESFKIVMVTLGMIFILTRDMVRAADSLPKQQITKALTLGASEFGTVLRLVMPQLVPHLLSALRIALIAGWTMLIAAEATSAQEGLGYRIIILKRRMDMAGIIPYVVIIATLSFMIDRILFLWIKHGFPHFHADK